MLFFLCYPETHQTNGETTEEIGATILGYATYRNETEKILILKIN